MSLERLDGSAADAFVSACVALARDAARSSVTFEPAMHALEATWAERPWLHAPTFSIDLMALALGERLTPLRTPPPLPLRDACRAYEDHVLARLTQDRRWVRWSEAVASAPTALKPIAVGLTVAQLLARLELEGGTGVSQAVVRRLATRSADEVLEAGRAALLKPAVAASVADGLMQLAHAARRARELLSDAEVFLVENVAALKGLGPRVALAQLAAVSQAIEEQLPVRLRGATFEHGEAPTALEEDSAYPVGGFSSITTSGTLENLVTSELMYLERDDTLRPDLFDVRFVESELLYYARDEAVAVRRKRHLLLVFDASLAAARVLDSGERYQRLVWLLGAAAALVRKLAAWLDHEALTFELAFVSEAEGGLSEEAAVVALLLRDYRTRGQLDVHLVSSAAEAVRDARDRFATRLRSVVFFTKWPQGLEGLAAPDVLVDASQRRSTLSWVDGVSGPAPAEAAPLVAWSDALVALVDGLVRKSRTVRPKAP